MEDTLGQMDAFMKESFSTTLSIYHYNFRHGDGKVYYPDGR
jgi:hypothetical protein